MAHHFAVHTKDDLCFVDGTPSNNLAKSQSFEGKIKAFIVSQDGKKLAWIASGQVSVAEAPSWTVVGSLKHPRAQEICFSPQGSYLAIWDSYVKTADQSQLQPNLSVYDVSGKKLLKAFFQQSQVNWKPQWTNDETIFARNVSNEIHFYEANDLQNISIKKILPKVRSFSLSPSTKTHHVTFFVPSVKGAPAYVHLYRYPDFQESSSALANKSFFKGDTVDTLWNKQSTACLLLTAAEVDKSGTSYYGEQMLFYLNTRGHSERITFSKKGNIHSVCWCPSGQEFFAVYGTMPSHATLFNHKCEVVAEFGTGARNTVLVNPVGNIVLVGGFGNISARYEMWDIKTGKVLGQTECPDTTHVNWSPCGQYILTATCSPRLRVNNGYKLWHYTAVLMREGFHDELYAATWIPDPTAAKPFTISTAPVTGITSSVAVASKQKYVPPSQRGAKGPPGANVTLEKKFLSQVDVPPKAEAPLSKSAIKNKKKKEAAKKKRDEEGEKEWVRGQTVGEISDYSKIKSAADDFDLTGDPEKDKKIKKIKRKLIAIAKLKGEQENGKPMVKTQIEKIATEDKLIEELKELAVSITPGDLNDKEETVTVTSTSDDLNHDIDDTK
ncbi:hypothetical protein Pcinc_003034 [Petrolisthes cinctipes]|uniref:Eukaryotic translation initiation factor 2A n=1 Tax=Petrolisthes cinctipes TaxID=88211 RepID=A0AAE1L1P7_PETCI|nr:hypothetical protein Pcinc_003034 [Petrolisthes cinctipes]